MRHRPARRMLAHAAMRARPQPPSAGQIRVFCALYRPVDCGSRARISRQEAWLSEELRCRCVSCGEDVSG